MTNADRVSYRQGVRGDQFRPYGIHGYLFWPTFRGPRIRSLPRMAQFVVVALRNIRLYVLPRRIEFKYMSDGMATKSILPFMSEDKFLESYERMIQASGFPNDPGLHFRIHQAIWCASIAKDVDGDFVECGTGRGLVFSAVLNSISNWNELGKRLWLFDTFEPHHLNPASGINDPSRGVHDRYAVSFGSTEENFRSWSNVTLVPGLLPDSLSELPDSTTISLLHIDLNHAPTEVNVLRALWPRISRGGVVLLDDFGSNIEQNEAMVDTAKSIGVEILSTASSQGIIIKT